MEVPEVVGRDFLQYLAQGDPRGSSAAGKNKKIKNKNPSNDPIASTKSQRGLADSGASLSSSNDAQRRPGGRPRGPAPWQWGCH
jgi:hypothetical protein